MERTITVSATGTSSAAPDIATVSTGVVAEGKTAREALAANTEAMKKLVDGVKAGGVEPKDIQTSSFAVDPVYSEAKDGLPPRIVGYRVTNQVAVIVRNLAKLGDLLDQMVSLGANQINSLTFDVDKAEALRDRSRKLAIVNALRRAQLYAKAAGADVGEVITIVEDGYASPPVPLARQTFAANAVPIESGSLALEARVTVTWALK